MAENPRVGATTAGTDALFDVSGRVVAVTGACGLIGRALLLAFAARGAKLALIDIREANPAELAREMGQEAEGFPCDVTRATEIDALLESVVRRFGRVDVLINSHHFKPKGFTDARAETFPEELWDAILNVNLKATFLTCRAFGRAMLAQGKGSIINMASTYGVVSSNPDLYEENSLGNPVAYSASKGGVIMLTKYLGVHWAERGVRVNCVTPHGVWNEHEPAFVERFARKSPMRRLMTPEEVVGAVLFLASDASAYATASNLMIDGGWTAW
jgi:NAD(P)-dependent dehydrogenase (short-subunit alcohol dehydrogenase family)